MPAATIPAGTIFSKLTVIGDAGRIAEKNGRKNPLVECQCVCGNKKTVRVMHLKSGHAKSCGCTIYDKIRKHHKAARLENKRGFTPTFKCWASMIQRCTNPNDRGYSNYGGRGIKVCERWLNSFANFLEDMGEKPSDLSIERLDNEKGYEPGNTAWRTSLEQGQNRRSTIRVTYHGISGSLLFVCRHFGINWATYKRIWRKVKAGQSPDSAIATESGFNPNS